jgi:hypothetical protein
MCCTACFMPGGCPCPEVLTEQEAIRFLRIDTTGVKNPETTLRYYREQGLLRGTQIGRNLFYTKTELLSFLSKQTEFSNRKNTA